jgi:hypothetical protein
MKLNLMTLRPCLRLGDHTGSPLHAPACDFLNLMALVSRLRRVKSKDPAQCRQLSDTK